MSQFTVLASAGIKVNEIDLSTVIPQIAGSPGAFAGVFRWGPIGQITLIPDEATLAKQYLTPTNFNAETFFTAANFLSYAQSLYISRAANTTDPSGANGVMSAFTNTAPVGSNIAMTVLNSDDYISKSLNFDSNVQWVGKYPGAAGNSLRVAQCDSTAQWQSNLAVANVLFTVGSNSAILLGANNSAANTIFNSLTVGDILLAGNGAIGQQYLKITSITSPGVGSNVGLTFASVYRLTTNWNNSNTVQRSWEFFKETSTAPGQSQWMTLNGNTAANDQLHVVVVDQNGTFTGIPGTVLETWAYMSRATDGQNPDGSTNYYKNVINHSSAYIWFGGDRTGATSNTGKLLTNSTNLVPYSQQMALGSDGPTEANVALADLGNAYNLFKSPEDVAISLIMVGKNRATAETTADPSSYAQLANYISDNITDIRKDCVFFVSAPYSTVVNNSDGRIAQDIVTFANALRNTSYGVCDSGYKYMYDKYNDIYRYVPLNGDIAGLCARVDSTNAPWWSPAGLNRGQIKNIVKLAFNPRQSERDLLYPNRVNPVVTFQGLGTVLYGDKTLDSNAGSAFSRINVRRLFITLEVAIATVAKFELFEFNDTFTQNAFKNMVNPFLRNVQGQRGIIAFFVVCDDTNNTGQVIDNEGFVGDIFIKPARAINFINLNFYAVATNVTFQEILTNQQ